MRRSRGRVLSHRLFGVEALDLGLRNTEPHVDRVIEEFLKSSNMHATRWIQMPKAILLFLTVPEGCGRGGVFVYERERQEFYFVFFEYGGHTLTLDDFKQLSTEYHLVRYAERPGMLRRAQVPNPVVN